MKVKACIKSMRLRTLPLSLAGVMLGAFIAASRGEVRIPVTITLILTASLLQILSNLSNELGDTLHGTDTEDRQGIRYSLQDGEMTVQDMKLLIFIAAAACCACGAAMVYLSFGTFFALEPILFLILGAAAIWAAMHYTLGENPYGYRGLGDIFVFIFFGLVSVCGGCYICLHDPAATLEHAILPACSLGCFSVAVLNVNNIRDMKTDAANRVTTAIRLGGTGARIYQTVLILTGWVSIIANTLWHGGHCWYLFLLPLYIAHIKGVWTLEGRALDKMLPLLVMSTFVFSLIAGLGL